MGRLQTVGACRTSERRRSIIGAVLTEAVNKRTRSRPEAELS
jgi:hypothetical protein